MEIVQAFRLYVRMPQLPNTVVFEQGRDNSIVNVKHRRTTRLAPSPALCRLCVIARLRVLRPNLQASLPLEGRERLFDSLACCSL
jgi:hypothetical protein